MTQSDLISAGFPMPEIDGGDWDDEAKETSEEATSEEATSEDEKPTEWGRLAADIAWSMSGKDFSQGELAELRRMDPESANLPGVYWRIMANHGLMGSPAVEKKWAIILHGIALMTISSDGGGRRTAHDGYMPVGRALYVGGTKQMPGRPYYSEIRLNRIMKAKGHSFRLLLKRLFMMMRAVRQQFNWAEMSRLILAQDYDDEGFKTSKRRISREYYRAERVSINESEQEQEE